MIIPFMSYPARPINGGPLETALPKNGVWKYEPKYNGWRAMVHLPSGAIFNRQGETLSIGQEFTDALRLLCSTLDCEAFKWADVEALSRRHTVGRGCLIVLDAVPTAYTPTAAATYSERRAWLDAVIPELDLMPGQIPLISLPPWVYSDTAWTDLQMINRRLGAEFYEGLVAKKADQPYPIQLLSPEREFPFWVKHRWKS